MAEAAKKAIYRAVMARLTGMTGAGTNIYTDYVPENKLRPYLLLQIQSNVSRNFHVRLQDPDIILLVKAVSEDTEEALDIKQEALELLDDQGEQDLGNLAGGADWYILKAMVEESVFLTYKTGVTRLFEEGFQIRITLEEKINA